MPSVKRSGRPWGPIRAENPKAQELAQFLRKQVEMSGKTLADFSREMNFSKSLISANLSGAIPKPEFLKALIIAAEKSHGVRSKKIQHALTLRDEARAVPSRPTAQVGPSTQQDLTQSLIRSLQDQIALERALRSATQLNWALLWRAACGSPFTAEVNPDQSEGGAPLEGERPDQPAEVRPQSPSEYDSFGSTPTHVSRERIALSDLTPAAFEVLVRDLFTAIGFTAWAENRASTDRGFDAVTINEDPVMGGSVLIQVKKIKGPVSVESISALAGAVDHERATKGFLVTTSRFTPSAREFAARSGRIELIDGRSLQALLSQHLGVEAEL